MKERVVRNGNGNGAAPATESPMIASANVLFEDHRLLPQLYGQDDAHLAKIESKFHVTASSRGNMLALSGDKLGVETSRAVMQSLYNDLRTRGELSEGDVDAAIRMALQAPRQPEQEALPGLQEYVIKTMKKHVRPYSAIQTQYIQALQSNDLVFALGPAGTGKTYIAVAMAVNMFINRKVDRIILSRPAVEAGEKLGFLPGDLKEKVDPFLRPLYDALFDMLPAEKVEQMMVTNEIEVAPLAFMRGRTLSNACIILDEAQNTTPTQMKMFLTRLGEHSRMIVTGDLSQTDLPRDVKSGLGDAIRKLEGIEGIQCIRFSDADVVRHQLAARIVQAYEEWDRKKQQRNNT